MLARRTLPPGVEQDQVVFGIMWIRVGNFKPIRNTMNKDALALHIQFWGEPTPAVLRLDQSALQEYDIRCPVSLFSKYLRDMKHNLKIVVDGVGRIRLDIQRFMHANVTQVSKSVFDHFKQSFEVLGPKNRKVASIELEMATTFNPVIAMRQLALVQDPSAECPAAQQIHKREKQSQHKKIKQKKENSLDEQGVGVGGGMGVGMGVGIDTSHVDRFPQISKILTYSNLRLHPQSPTDKSPVGNVMPVEGSPLKRRLIESPIKEQEAEKGSPARASETQQLDIIPNTFSDPDEKLFADFYGDRYGNVSEEQAEIKKKRQDNDMAKIGERFVEGQEVVDKLSRVVNLAVELEKERKQSPTKQQPKKQQDSRELSKSQHLLEVRHPMTRGVQMHRPMETYGKVAQNRTMGSIRAKPFILLNLILQITSSSICLSQKCLLIHKPYLQKQRIKLGPHFAQSIRIMNPVSEVELGFMDKVPFILQFWGAISGKFLGLIRIDLARIKRGFLLQGRINETAIKTSVLPTMIHKGPMDIVGVNGGKCGECQLQAAIGTSGQIETYFNTVQHTIKRMPRIEQKEMKQEIKPVDVKPVEVKPVEMNKILQSVAPVAVKEKELVEGKKVEDFSELLSYIDVKNEELLPILMELMGHATVTVQQFREFIYKIGFPKDMSWLLVRNKQIKPAHISVSFNDYKELQRQMQNEFRGCVALLPETHSTCLASIREHSAFNVISKHSLRAILKPIILESALLDRYLSFFGDTINADLVVSSLKKESVPLVSDCECYEALLENMLMDRINIEQDSLLKGVQSVQSVHELQGLLSGKEHSLSLWLVYKMIGLIKVYFEEVNTNCMQISVPLLYSWLTIKQEQRRQRSPIINPIIKQPPSINERQEGKQNEMDIHQNKAHPTPELKITPTNQAGGDNLNGSLSAHHHEQDDNSKQIGGENGSGVSVSKQVGGDTESHMKHSYTVSVIELVLEEGVSGTCTVAYTFPHDEERVTSKKVNLFKDKHKYALQCGSKHTFTITDTLPRYFADSCLHFQLILDSNLYAEGNLHTDDLMISVGTEQRVVPLFRDTMVGRVKLQVQYQSQPSEGKEVGQETVRNVFLPKNGFINYKIETQLDARRIKQQLNIKEDFYLLLSIDLFGQSAKLRNQFPPCQSKLCSDLSQTLSVSGHYKLSLTPQVLEYLKNKSCLLSLVVVYYVKEGGNFERKEALFGSSRVPLLGLIKDELKGQYAFKNKLGVFIALVHCSIQYQKHPQVSPVQESLHVPDRKKESYWVLLHFVEFINFERQEPLHIRFEFVNQGIKYATSKEQLREGTYHSLSQTMLLHLTDEQFRNMKLIPVSVITNSSKMAVDVNMRPISKALLKAKYTLRTQYFLVVDHQSRTRKMRVGLRVFAFRGTSQLASFVDTLNLSLSLGKELDVPPSQDYPHMAEEYRKMLRISTKQWQETMEMLLNNKKDRLSLQFFTREINMSLGVMMAEKESDVDALCSEMVTEVEPEDLLTYMRGNSLQLTNFRPEFLNRFCFRQLNSEGMDKNVQYLGLESCVDLVAFVRKIVVEPKERNPSTSLKQVTFTVIRGYNFHYLYNGIKPNAFICIPAIGMETAVLTRTADPIYHQSAKQVIQNLNQFRKIKLEVYHMSRATGSSMDQEDEPILIGEGTVSLMDSMSCGDLPHSKVYKVIVCSTMSSQMKASLDLQIDIDYSYGEAIPVEEMLEVSEEEESGVESIMERMNKSMRRKEQLFQSSDDSF